MGGQQTWNSGQQESQGQERNGFREGITVALILSVIFHFFKKNELRTENQSVDTVLKKINKINKSLKIIERKKENTNYQYHKCRRDITTDPTVITGC